MSADPLSAASEVLNPLLSALRGHGHGFVPATATRALLAAHGGTGSATDVEALRGVCHDLVQERFEAAGSRGLVRVPSTPTEATRWQLRYQALEGLRSIGDEQSIGVLRTRWRRAGLSPPSTGDRSDGLIERLSFEIAEEIYWRLTGGLSAETYLPLGGGAGKTGWSP